MRQGDAQGRARSGGPTNEGRGAVLGPGPIALAGAAIVAVVAATVWVLAARGEEGASSTDRPAPATSAPIATEDTPEGTIYLWDPSTGEGEIVWHPLGEPSDAELLRDGRLVYASMGSDGISQIYLHVPGETDQPLTDLDGGALEPTWSPNGSRIAFSGSLMEGADTDIFVMNADGSDLRRWFRTPRDDGDPDWSPDGKQIAFHSEGGVWPPGRILVASVRTRAVTLVTGPFAISGPAWSPDGRSIAFSGSFSGSINGRIASSQISLLRPTGEDAHRIGEPASGEHIMNPSWSPDGRFIVFENFGSIEIIDPRTEWTWETPALSQAADPSWSREGILVTLPSDPPELPPGPAPGFEVEKGIDATITMTGRTCVLEGAGALPPGELTLEFVNASRLDGSFTMIRLAPGQTIEDLEADPGSVVTMHRSQVTYVDASLTDTWSTGQVVAGDRWAVACWRDEIPAPNGFAYRPFRIVEFSVVSEGGD